MKLGILKTDTVRPEWVPQFGEYPDMFVTLLGRNDPSLEFAVYDVEAGEYPEDIDDVDSPPLSRIHVGGSDLCMVAGVIFFFFSNKFLIIFSYFDYGIKRRLR